MGKLSPKPVTRLRIGLHDPGLTPILRAGLGGLAAAAAAIGAEALDGAGTITIEPTAVTLSWAEPGGAGRLLEKLFAACFRIEDGLISLPGTFGTEAPLEVRVATTDALRLTFLQHGSSAKKDGRGSVRTFEIDEKPHSVLVQGYREFVHQSAWKEIGKVLDRPPTSRGTITFAGWANPGAAERHVGLGRTHVEYRPCEAICACFTIVGCVSLQGPHRTGVLLIPEPSDLQLFAKARPRMSPRVLRKCFVASSGDGVLTVWAALKAAELQDAMQGVSGMSATTTRSTPWAKQQKTRTDALVATRYDGMELDGFFELMTWCPSRVLATKGKKGEPGGYWGVPSALRGFVADNVARHRRFYAGFAVAKTGDDPPRWLHRVYSSNDQLGALRFPDDQRGLIAMINTLREEADRLLVASIHTALRQRFAEIGKENSGNPVAFRNRCKGERDKWRLQFVGARTSEQIRHALADLWSRAGYVRELRGDAWHTLQPLLEATEWERARDLALIALASYQGKEAEDTPNDAEQSRLT